MSRHGYHEDLGSEDQWAYIRWRGAVASATRGARGQAMLRDLLAALEAMPDKRLVAESFVEPEEGACCTLGALCVARGVDVSDLQAVDPDDFCGDEAADIMADRLGVARALTAEIMYENDSAWFDCKTVVVHGPVQWKGKQFPMTRLVSDPAGAEHRRWKYMHRWVKSRISAPAVGA